MSAIDWLVLILTITTIVLYGIWKSRGTRDIQSYLLADRKLPWYHVGLSVMATQASAITFLSAPGQAYSDGMRFVQFYFGLPLAMVVLCITFVPIFHRLKVFTAYEYLEKRFDNKTRTLTAFLFLIQRGISTGITIYAPSIVLSTILSIDITLTTLFMGGLVIIYTVYGGTRAVSHTQLLQMSIIFTGLFFAGFMVVHLLPENVGFFDALHIAGKMGKLNAIDTTFDPNNRYNIWSGIIGGFFLQLSYFGTDQSQVGRYLTGSSIAQSRMGLIMNGLVKIPMQFLILLIGTLVFAFYQFHQPPLFFNQVELQKVGQTEAYQNLETEYQSVHQEKQIHLENLIRGLETNDEAISEAAGDELLSVEKKAGEIRQNAYALMKDNNPEADTNDTNYIFLTFVTNYLPQGLVGLLIAIIFLASMGSTASGMNSLASTTVIDVYKRLVRKDDETINYLNMSRLITVGWGIFCVLVALYASRLGNLIEAVNILGSLFYGTILGIFIVAFYLKRIMGTAVFYAALVAEGFVVITWSIDLTAYLWLNVTGCLLVMIFGGIFERFRINQFPHHLLLVSGIVLAGMFWIPRISEFSASYHAGSFPLSYREMVIAAAALCLLLWLAYMSLAKRKYKLLIPRLHIISTLVLLCILLTGMPAGLVWIFAILLAVSQLLFMFFASSLLLSRDSHE